MAKKLSKTERKKAIQEVYDRLKYYEEVGGFPPSFPVTGVRALIEDHRSLSRQFVLHWHGAEPEIDRKDLNALIQRAGLPSGLSEDSYFDITQPT